MLLKIASKNYPHKISSVYTTGFDTESRKDGAKYHADRPMRSPSWQNCEVGLFVLNCITSLIKDYNCLPFIPSQPKAQSLVVPSKALHPPSSQHPGRLFRPHSLPYIIQITYSNHILNLKNAFPQALPLRLWILWLGAGPEQLCLKAPEESLMSNQGWEPCSRQVIWKGLRICIRKLCFEVPAQSS